MWWPLQLVATAVADSVVLMVEAKKRGSLIVWYQGLQLLLYAQDLLLSVDEALVYLGSGPGLVSPMTLILVEISRTTDEVCVTSSTIM